LKRLFITDYTIILKKNHILIEEQFGFRHTLSTDNASHFLTKNILTALNNKLLVGGIFCDLHKVFDCVNHDILLSKIEFYGISGKANSLIKSYLQDRYQRVLVDQNPKSYYSEWESVTDQVPQGSILGPLLFLFYINDIPNLISNISNPILYADDTSLIISNSDTQMFQKHKYWHLTTKQVVSFVIIKFGKNLLPSILN
jgi:hypothetical protein